MKHETRSSSCRLLNGSRCKLKRFSNQSANKRQQPSRKDDHSSSDSGTVRKHGPMTPRKLISRAMVVLVMVLIQVCQSRDAAEQGYRFYQKQAKNLFLEDALFIGKPGLLKRCKTLLNNPRNVEMFFRCLHEAVGETRFLKMLPRTHAGRKAKIQNWKTKGYSIFADQLTKNEKIKYRNSLRNSFRLKNKSQPTSRKSRGTSSRKRGSTPTRATVKVRKPRSTSQARKLVPKRVTPEALKRKLVNSWRYRKMPGSHDNQRGHTKQPKLCVGDQTEVETIARGTAMNWIRASTSRSNFPTTKRDALPSIPAGSIASLGPSKSKHYTGPQCSEKCERDFPLKAR